jgi:hypothetical protein
MSDRFLKDALRRNAASVATGPARSCLMDELAAQVIDSLTNY